MSVFDELLAAVLQIMGLLFVLVTLVTLSCLVEIGFLGSLLRRSDAPKVSSPKKRFWHRSKKLEGDRKELTE